MNKNVIVLGKECNNNNNSIPDFIYRDSNNKNSMQYKIVRENSNDWKIYFYESGTLTFLQNKPEYLDVFLVGGGSSSDAGGEGAKMPGSGGAGGFTSRGIIKLNSDINEYSIIVGKGGTPSGATGVNGEDSSAFNLIAKGGIAPNSSNNYIGQGGSGGGGYTTTNDSDDSYKKWTGADGGSNGKNGSGNNRVGQGQGFTTREFYEPNGILYAGGGGGASSATDGTAGGKGGEGGGGNGSTYENKYATPGLPNTGGGGGAYNYDKATAGGSGIVVIRNLRNS